MKGIKNECQLMERCDGHGGGVRGWRGVMVMKEVVFYIFLFVYLS